MKKRLTILLAAVIMLFGINAAQAQNTEYGVFNHLGLGVSAGLDGLGFDLAAPITDWAAVRVGMSMYPKIAYKFDVDIDSESNSFITDEVEVEAKLNISDFKMLFDFYPAKKSSFHLTAGAYIGTKKLVSVKNTEQFLRESAWGTEGIKLGDYRITSDKNGNIEANIEVAGFKPYVGIGFGRAVPKKSRVSVSFDMGVKFWGSPGVYTYTEDNFGNRTYDKLTKGDVDDEDADKVFDTMSKISVFPVMTLRLCGRIF